MQSLEVRVAITLMIYRAARRLNTVKPVASPKLVALSTRVADRVYQYYFDNSEPSQSLVSYVNSDINIQRVARSIGIKLTTLQDITLAISCVA